MATLIEDTLSVREDFELQHDRLVREEIETFRQKANAFLAGEIPEEEFRPFRLKHGIYGQRQPGVQMVRCKVPGGLMTAAQMEQMARISEKFAGGKGHLTTRQNMQYHFVPLAQVADLMHMLADTGLVETQATAEKDSYTRAQLNQMLDLAEAGIQQLLTVQRAILDAAL